MRAETESAVDQVRRLLALRRFAGFAELPPEDLAALAERVEERFFPAGTTVFEEGAPVGRTLFILEGEIHLRRGGRDLRSFGDGGVVGGLASLTGDPAGLAGTATRDTWTFELTAEDLMDTLEESWAILTSVMRSLGNEVVELRRGFGEHAGYPAEATAGTPPAGELDLLERLAVLRRDSPFESGRIESLAELARDARQVRFAAGEPLWSAGDRSGWHLRLLSGVVRCETEGGRQHFRFGAHDVVGAMDTMASLPRWYAAAAETEVHALRLEGERLLDVMEDHPDLAFALVRVLAATVQQLLDAGAGTLEPA